jgi:hypothetical protein
MSFDICSQERESDSDDAGDQSSYYRDNGHGPAEEANCDSGRSLRRLVTRLRRESTSVSENNCSKAENRITRR